MRFIAVKKEKILIVLYLLIIFVGLVTTVRRESVAVFSMPMSKKVVLIDSGHGGWDPGKIGEGNVLEKDINLKIARKLQTFLEQGGSFVITTRTEDEALGDTKSGDMRERKRIANDEKAGLMVSIHQNSFTQAGVHGAQVFYYEESEESKKLAECIQKELKSFLDNTNRFEAKSSTAYYVLKKTTIPTVIVECGFLSNENEKNNLSSEEYQEKVAWAIYTGIVNFCKQ